MAPRYLETYRGLYVDLSSLSLNSIEMERKSLYSRHYFLRSFVRLIYSSQGSYPPPTQEDLDRRQRERAQIETPISPGAYLGRKGGLSRTPAKTRASQANGQKGGRPKQTRDTSAFD